MTERELVDRAFAMLERSYAPYSHFPVGAALECADGTVFTGCNVENAAYGSTICAERTAVVKAVSEGHRDDFVRIAIVGRSEDYCWPCGSCRQVLFEFAPDLECLIARGDGDYVKLPLRELLSHGFGPKALL
ncbi:cytidine deaminase [Intestinimonas butyriciproducens]|uniref:Cytidine deaminase n=1 Tax=Candidatus Intestinimonas merdavium TaxID=2838622 RepID=A0A9D2CFT3_9FIRM|nr:cytidine deaminase [Intestinimonas butyriciproducens]MBM6977497.1 cytidine deaminase [Intestinimonas butyriciproducens]HIY74595.1 cytidine deaminase [Candidatus Intestinimonas merdavium]